MVNFIDLVNGALTRYFGSLETIGFQRDSETYKILTSLFILHCLNDEEIFRNLTNKQLSKLSLLIECLYNKSCVFKR